MDLLLDGEEVDEGLVDPAVGVVPLGVEQAAEGVLHRPGRRRVDVGLDRGQVDDVLAEEVVGDRDPLGEDVVEDVHLRLGAIRDPLHVLVLEVVADGDVVLLEERQVVVEVLALEGVGHDRLVLNADDLLVAAAAEREDRPLHLPRRRVRARERVVPGDVVLEDRGGALLEGVLHPGEVAEAIDVLDDVVGLNLQNRNLALHLRAFS